MVRPVHERLFFTGMGVLILLAVFVGFAKSYYLAGAFLAPLPSLAVHLHGAAFSAWVLLFITQTSLVGARRLDLHRSLGSLGFGLACLLVVLGLAAAIDSMARGYVDEAHAMGSRAFFAVAVADMVAFGVLVWLGYRNRGNRDAHKRLMLLATIVLLDAAFVRWPVGVPWWGLQAAQACCLLLLLLLAAWDLWSRGAIHPCTLWPGLCVIALELLRGPIGRTPPWQAFAGWVQHAALLLR